MPGIKSVVWNDTNKARALDALLALNSLKVSKDISEQVRRITPFLIFMTELYTDRHLYRFVISTAKLYHS